jgi:hypothetical protein
MGHHFIADCNILNRFFTVSSPHLSASGETAFDIMYKAAFIGDDERALELPEAFRVDSKIGLKRVLHFDSGRHIDKRPAGKNGAVQRAELVVTRRDDLAKPFSEDLGMLVKALCRTDKTDPLFADRLFDIRIGGLAVELRFDAGEEFALLFGDAEPLESALHIVRDVFPVAFRLGAAAQVVADIVKDDRFQILARPMRRQGLAEKGPQGFEPKFPHPIGILFHVRDVVDRLFAQADAGIVGVRFRVSEIAEVPFDIECCVFLDHFSLLVRQARVR